MFNKITIILILFGTNYLTFAQNNQNVAPIDWQRYLINELKVTTLFPKMPVRQIDDETCHEQRKISYAAYAEGVVYGLTIFYKFRSEGYQYCKNPREFSKSNLQTRLTELRQNYQEKIYSQKGQQINKFSKDNRHYWLIDDAKNKRWLEFWVAGADEDKKEVATFISSLKYDDRDYKYEVGNGALSSLGDEKVEIREGKTGSTGLRLFLKPRSNYTEMARKNQVQGTVTLRVSFLANGSIGNVSVVSALPDGLTEQAISAVRKIVFIPANRDGYSVTVVKQVQYTFTLY